MPVTQKRSAPETPNGRPSKRQATSSPEEGEVDDGSAVAKPIGLPPRPEVSKLNFPFKKKAVLNRPQEIRGMDRRVPAVYERSEEDERRIREQEERERRENANGIKRQDGNKRGNDRLDSWRPEDDSHTRDRLGHHELGRRIHHSKGYDSYQPTYDGRRGWEKDRDRTHSPPRARTPSPHSKSRSRSSHSSSEGRGKHRLPHATTYADTVPSPRYSPHSPPRYFNSPPRPYFHERDARDQYYREDDDNYYRPNYSYDDRERDRYGHSSSPDPRSSRGRTPSERQSHISRNSLSRPHSPPRSPLRSPRNSLRSPSRPSRSPRPPQSSPPPVPLDNTLPAKHNAVHIQLKRPGAPLEKRSPPSLQLPSVRVDMDKAPPPKPKPVNDAIRKEANERSVTRKRKPVRRTREQEKEAYHRVFLGCGQKDDYDITTKLGEGTFGEVHKAISKARKITVAIKRILMHNEKEGMPVTALREIKILKAMKHPCVIELLDMFIVSSDGKDQPMSVYMVFPYMDHDLAGLLANERVKLQPSQIKLYMKQLLEGTEYMHCNKILHRDMKAANLLIDNSGCLRIADFGLARVFDPNIVTRTGKFNRYGHERKYTNCVVTRWYRPPELLLGARQYGGEVDIWGIGCILGEMFWRRPILTGNSDLDQLEKIWALCGSPNQQNWPDFDKLPGCEGQIRFGASSRKIKNVYETIGKETCDLLDKLLTLDPRERISATDALDHDYFWSDPLPADPKTLPTYESSHEFDQRGRYNAAPFAPPIGNQPPKAPGAPNAPRHNLPPPLHNRQRNYQQRNNLHHHFQQNQQFQQVQQPQQPQHTQQHVPPPPPNLPPPPLPPPNTFNNIPPPVSDAGPRGWNGPPTRGPRPFHPGGLGNNNPYQPPPFGGDNTRMARPPARPPPSGPSHNQSHWQHNHSHANAYANTSMPRPSSQLPNRPPHLPARPPTGLPPKPDFTASVSSKFSQRETQQRHANGVSSGGGLNYG